MVSRLGNVVKSVLFGEFDKMNIQDLKLFFCLLLKECRPLAGCYSCPFCNRNTIRDSNDLTSGVCGGCEVWKTTAKKSDG